MGDDRNERPWVPSTQKGIFGNVVGWTLGIFALVVAVILLSWGFGWIFAGPKGALQARQEIKSGPFRIEAYNRFFNLCSSVQTKEGTILALQEELATKPSESRREQINAAITANRAGRIADIRQYNQDAQKSWTEGQFRSRKLPFQLDPTAKETTCAI